MMLRNFINLAGILITSVLFMSCGKSTEYKLFNGELLEGWERAETVFRVEDGAIVGGNLNEPLEQTFYLCTKQKLSI